MENILKVSKIYIILNTPVTSRSMSGGDKIFIKVSEVLQQKYQIPVVFIACSNGINLVRNSTNCSFEFYELNKINGEGNNIFLTYFLRILLLYRILYVQIEKDAYVFSASDFITDSLGLLILKIKYPNRVRFFSSMFLRKELPKKFKIKDFLFLISQRITILMTRYLRFGIFTNKIDVNFLKSRGIEDSKIIVLPGGTEEIKIKEGEKKYDGCFIGRIAHQKGLDLLLQICSLTIQVKPTFKLGLIVSGTEEEISDLKSEISSQNLQNSIHFLGFLDNEEKYEVLARSKILLFPSRFESFGIVVLESLSLGVPVVSFDLESLRLNFTDGVVYSKNVEDFTDNLVMLLDNDDLRNAISIRAKESSQGFTWEKITEKFLKDLV